MTTPTLPPPALSYDSDEIDGINAHKDVDVFECDDCGRTFANAHGLDVHVGRAHGTTGPKKATRKAKRSSRAIAKPDPVPPPAPVTAPVPANGRLEELVAAIATELVDRALADARVRLLTALGVQP